MNRVEHRDTGFDRAEITGEHRAAAPEHAMLSQAGEQLGDELGRQIRPRQEP